MLGNNTKKLVALGISLTTLSGAIPTIISPIPVFASQEEEEQTPYDDAEGNHEGIDTTCTTSASVKVSNPLGELATIVNLNIESDTEGSFEQKYVIISGIKFQLIDSISKYVSVVGESLEANANLVLPSKIQWNNETFTVTSIGERAFEKCNRLTSIIIPSSIESIGNYAFFECNGLTKINVDADNNNYESNDGVLFNKNATKLIQYPIGKMDEKYEIPSSVTNISEYAFLLCSKLENIEIQTSVTKIEDYAFLACNWKVNFIVHNDDIKKYLLKCNSRIQNFQITVVTLDTSKLGKLYDAYKKTSQGNYTDESFKVFTGELNHAKSVLDKKTAATQTEVDNTEKALKEAINGLKEKIEVIGITINGEDSISQSGGSTNLTVIVSPDDATNKNVTWSIVSGNNLASITQNGTLMASKSGNGRVTVRATAKDNSNAFGEKTIIIATDTSGLKNLYDDNEEKLKGNYTDESLSIFTKALDNAKTVLNRIDATQTEVDNAEKALKEASNGLKEKIEVIGITVIGEDSISQSVGSTNLTVIVSPDDATNKNVIWSIVSGNNLASITQDGTLMASKSGNGSVTVRATAKDNSNVFGEKTITIATDTSGLKNLYDDNEEKLKGNYTDESLSIFTKALDNAKTVLNRIEVTQTEVNNAEKALQEAINGLKEKIEVIGITVIGEDSISQSGGSTNLTVIVSPDDATNKNVIWSIVSGNNLASITQDGTLTANKSGNGSVTVRAAAKANSNVFGEKTITIDNNGLYIITASAGVNGTITPYGILSMTENDDSTYNVTPNLGYEINDVTVDGVSIGAVNSYTFEKITTEHTISATFKVKNSTSSISIGSSSKNKSNKIIINNIDEATISALNIKNIKTVMVNDNWYYLDNISGYMKIFRIISSRFLG